MPLRPPVYRAHMKPREVARREFEARRREQKPWRALYKTAAWQALRQRRLAEEPLCRTHLQRGEVVPADTVNHIRPHKGDVSLFYDFENTESLCKRCHDSDAQRNERRGPASA